MPFPILASNLHKEELALPFPIDSQWEASHQCVAVLTGGTEQAFQSLVANGDISLQQPVYILASHQSNSLAASLEILSWIQQQGGTGKVITRPEMLNDEISSTTLHCQPTELHASGMRLGVIGKPSDWLIASQVDYRHIKQLTGIELIDVPIEEVSSLGEVDGGIAGAEIIYQRLKEIVCQYQLNGLTLRCFDLLSTVKNTGCMALSHLNDEGIPASCEGDIPLLLTMILAQQRYGSPGFQVNPAEIHANGEILLAHCTIPLHMTKSHTLSTHFESGIGVSIHGELPTGEYHLMKLSNDLSEYIDEKVEVTGNQYAPNLCRTQVWIKAAPALAQRLLTHPIANHLLLVTENKITGNR